MGAAPRSFSLTLRLPEPYGPVTLHLLDWGAEDARDVLVCVHGMSRNAHDFDRLAEALASRTRRVISVDMPGRGDSPWLHDPIQYHYGLYAAVCTALLDNFHLRRVDWVGTSMGGIIGMILAASPTPRIRKLVLNDIGAHVPLPGLARITDYLRNPPERFADRAEAEQYFHSVFAPFGLSSEEDWKAFIDSSITPAEAGGWRLKTDPAIVETIRVESKNFTALRPIELGALWAKVTCPALILRGEDSDILTEETLSAMRASHIRARSETIPGCGHAPALTTPEQIDIIRRFLEQKDDGLSAIIGA